MQHACRREVQRYDEKRAKIQASIAAAEQEIEAAKKALQEAQIVRQHEEECEASCPPCYSLSRFRIQRAEAVKRAISFCLCSSHHCFLLCCKRFDIGLRAWQVKKHDIMKHMGRPATAKEAEKVNAEVLSIQADSAQADALLAVRCLRITESSCVCAQWHFQ